SDPITKEEILKTRQHLGKVFEPLFKSMRTHQPEILVGSSGSFESFAEIIAARNRQTQLLDAVQSTEIPFSEFNDIYDQIVNSSRRERLLIPGLLEMRVDMIVLASIMIQLILEKANFKSILMSKYALKEGLLWSHYNKQTT
ncbi:MAG: phosphatase, partial [Bacteroidia bacterium]|nr:phosphatase [Bacteroidia bacterium]